AVNLRAEIVRLDKSHVWHPYTPMDRYIAEVDPLVIERASGARLFDVDGRSYLDANSSWWVASLGHAHPRLVAALTQTGARLVHVSRARASSRRSRSRPRASPTSRSPASRTRARQGSPRSSWRSRRAASPRSST